jgi:hypothetical protein
VRRTLGQVADAAASGMLRAAQSGVAIPPMCYFVFLGVSQRHVAGARETLELGGLSVAASLNPDVRASFPADDSVQVITRGGCSCDIYAQVTTVFDEDALRTRYRRKGWSSSKIERAVLAKRPAERAQFASFRSAVAAIVQAAGSVRLFAHSFSGDTDSERVVVEGSRTMTLGQYLESRGAYEVDVVCDLRS